MAFVLSLALAVSLDGWLAVGAAAAAGGDGGGVVRLETDGVAADYDSAVI